MQIDLNVEQINYLYSNTNNFKQPICKILDVFILNVTYVI